MIDSEDLPLLTRSEKLAKLQQIPFGNYIVMILAAVTFAIQFGYDYRQQYLEGLILSQWSFKEFIGYMWLHASLLHIVCNLIVLWVFGREVCRKIGNANYPFAYIFLGIAAAAAHVMYDGRPAIGASGAIMGVLGIHLVLCYRHLSPAGPWIILIWFMLNLCIGITNLLPIAYIAHVGGFFSGIVFASLLMFFGVVESKDTDPQFLRIIQQ